MNKRRSSSAKTDASTPALKKTRTAPTDTPKDETQLTTLSEAKKQCFKTKFPLLTRDAFFVGTYTALLPNLSFIGNIALYVIEYLFDGTFTADSYNVGGVELIDTCFDASDTELQVTGSYCIERIFRINHVDHSHDACHISAGKRGITISVPTIELASKLFCQSDVSLQDWPACQQALKRAGFTSEAKKEYNSIELYELSRFEYDDVIANSEYVGLTLMRTLCDVDTRQKMLLHAQRCVPLSDTVQQTHIEGRMASLSRISRFIENLREALVELDALSDADYRKLRRELMTVWARLRQSPQFIRKNNYNIRKQKHVDRLECLQGCAFKFVLLVDKWITGNDEFDTIQTYDADRAVEQRSHTLIWLASQDEIKPCKYCIANDSKVACPYK